MDPYTKTVSDDDGYKMLEDVVLHHRHGPEELLVPPRVPVDTVDRFLKDKVKPGLAHESVDRAGDVARFYHRTDAAKLFLALLTRKEKTAADLLVSISALRAVGNLGDDEQQKAAAEYYAYLLAHAQFDAVSSQMIELLFHLSLVPAKSATDALTARLARVTAAEKNKAEPSPTLAIAERQLHSLTAVLAARIAKDKILAIKDPAAQAKPVARLYLGFDNVGQADWFKWSALQLMTIVRVSGPDPAVAGLQAALTAAATTDPKEFRDAAASRGLKAVKFLGGTLTPEQDEALEHDNSRRFQLQG
jgi:hypothetical protein